MAGIEEKSIQISHKTLNDEFNPQNEVVEIEKIKLPNLIPKPDIQNFKNDLDPLPLLSKNSDINGGPIELRSALFGEEEYFSDSDDEKTAKKLKNKDEILVQDEFVNSKDYTAIYEQPEVVIAPQQNDTAGLLAICNLMGLMKNELTDQNSELKNDLIGIKIQNNNLDNKIDSQKVEFKKQNDDLKNKMEAQSTELKTNLGKINEKIESQNSELKSELKTNLGKINEKMEAQNKELQCQNLKIDQISDSVTNLKERYIPIIEENKAKIILMEEKIDNIEITIVNKIENKIINFDSKIKELQANMQRNKTTAFSFSEPIAIENKGSNEKTFTYPIPSALESIGSHTRLSNASPIFNIGKIPRLPVFDGDNFIASTFLLQAEDCFAIAGVQSDGDKIQAFKMMITGKVKNWLLGLKPQINSWPELKESFLEQWQPPFIIQRKLNEWKRTTIRQDGDIMGYVLEGLRLLEAINPTQKFNLTAEEIVLKLPWKIRESLLHKYTNFNTEKQLLEALQQTLRVSDLSYFERKNYSYSFKQNDRPNQENTDRRHNDSDNNHFDNPNRDKKNSNYRSNAGDRGHGRGRGDSSYRGRPSNSPQDRASQINTIFHDYAGRSSNEQDSLN